MATQKIIEVKCKYCDRDIINKSQKRHQNKCIVNPENSEKLAKYFLSSVDNSSLLLRKNYDEWAKVNNILSSKSLSARYGNDDKKDLKWEIILLNIIIELYEYKFIDLEIFDILITHKMTFGTYFMNSLTIGKNTIKIADKSPDLQEKINQGYEMLLFGVIKMAHKDKDTEFINSFYPEYYSKGIT